MACKSCGSEDGEVLSALGALVVVGCKGCGKEETFHLSPGPKLDDLLNFRPPEPGEPFKL